MIDKELRLKGDIMDFVMKTMISKSLKKKPKLTERIRKMSRDIIHENVFLTRDDGSKLRMAIFKTTATKPNATGLLWLHGGGFLMGYPEQFMLHCEHILRATNTVIVAPAYTHSTQMPYPAALDDCYSALLWLKNNASSLGVRNDQLFVAGMSAGGNLAIAVTLYARDKGEVNIAFQMPLYPMLNCAMDLPSASDNNAPIWNSKRNLLAWKKYLGDLYGKPDVPKYASPSKEMDYTNLPPAYSFVGDLDPLLDEDLDYFRNLNGAGIPAKITVYKGTYHAFEILATKAKISQRAHKEMIDEYVYATKNYFKEQMT